MYQVKKEQQNKICRFVVDDDEKNQNKDVRATTRARGGKAPLSDLSIYSKRIQHS